MFAVDCCGLRICVRRRVPMQAQRAEVKGDTPAIPVVEQGRIVLMSRQSESVSVLLPCS